MYWAGSDVGDIGNSNMVSEHWVRGSMFVSRKSRQDRSRSCFKVITCFAIQENEQREKKGNPPAPRTLGWNTVRLPPSNHSSCSDVPSKPHPMILHTINITPYQYNHATSSDVATPQLFPYHNKLYHHHLAAFPRISQRLRLSVTQFPPHHRKIPIPTPR